MKILSGAELSGFIKERQSLTVASLPKQPKLVIIRDSSNPVIMKYVNLKKSYGEDIGIAVEDWSAKDIAEVSELIQRANADQTVSGIIVQLPLLDKTKTDEITSLITHEKDVDGLSGHGDFDSATATAINWLLAGYGIDLKGKNIAIVGRGKLVGAPLHKMWTDSNYDVTIFHRGDDLTKLNQYDIIVTATGIPHLIKTEMIKPGAVVVDAGTASDNGILVGDLDEAVRDRSDLSALTPKVGGVGPLTVNVLFEHVIAAAR